MWHAAMQIPTVCSTNHYGNKYNRYSSQFRAEWDVFFK